MARRTASVVTDGPPRPLRTTRTPSGPYRLSRRSTDGIGPWVSVYALSEQTRSPSRPRSHEDSTTAGSRAILDCVAGSSGSDKDERAGWAFASDRPVYETSDDKLSRAGFASRLSEILARRSDPSSLVIALYGKWGEGKTSVLHFVRSGLHGQDDVIVINFNPWRFTGQDALTIAFFQALAAGLKRDLKKARERIGEWIEKYAGALVPSIKVGDVEVGAGSAAAGLGQLLSTVSLEDARDRLVEILREEGKRVVVVIDDIDRLDRDELHALFKLVKQSADFDYVSYLLAFDDEVVASAIGHRYGGGDSPAGHEFLEKIVQVPLRLPPADLAALRHLCLNGVEEAITVSGIEVPESEVQEFQAAYQMGLEPRLATPRIAKQYGNALLFSLPLLREEVNIVDLLLIEGVRIFYPKLYRAILDEPTVYLGGFTLSDLSHGDSKEQRLAACSSALEGLTDREQAAAKHVIKKLFPRTREFFENTSFGEGFQDTWTREKRICSRRYFNRYFTYAILEDDVSDREVEAFCDSLADASAEQVEGALQQMMTARNAENVIEKLRYRGESLTPAASKALALGIARSANILPNPEISISWFTPFNQGALLVSKLMKNLPVDEAEEFAMTVVEASHVDFAVRLLRFFSPDDEEDPPIRAEAFARVGAAVADQIKSFFEENPARLREDETSTRLREWSRHRSKDSIMAFVRPLVQVDPTLAVSLLCSFTPTAVGTGHAGPFKSDFDKSTYDYLDRCLEPKLIFEALVELYGDDVGASYDQGENTDRRIANQFAFLHRLSIENGTDERGDEEGSRPPEAQEDPVAE